MKLRIKGNSIRLRLLRSEVERFAREGRVVDEVRFGANGLRYSLTISRQAETIHATFEDQEISLLVPEAAARNWTTSELVGFETEQVIGEDQTLVILVEKDFACLDRPDDPDREQAYPNPNAAC